MPLDPDIRTQYPNDWNQIRQVVLEHSTGAGPLDRILEGELDIVPEACESIRSHYNGPSEACERCGAPQGKEVLRHDELWTLNVPTIADFIWFDLEAEIVTAEDIEGTLPPIGQADEVEVLLSVAHKCQDPRCDELDHLIALCRRCHMQLDFQPEHFYTRKLLYRELRGQQRLECCREPGCHQVVGQGDQEDKTSRSE